MDPLTLFTWGYWGWGNATRQFIQAADAGEAARGFAPPLFVDVRISRSVRAPGFNGHAFEEAVGSSRYRWMPELGNLAVTDGGDGIRIRDPGAAESLLDVAEAAAKNNRRVIFFCSCEFPGVDGEEGCCHRTRVAGLVLDAARRRGLSMRVAEWPGAELPTVELEIELDEPAYNKVRRGAVSVPLAEPVPLATMAGLGWGTPARVQCWSSHSAFRVLAGPARFGKTGWQLPILEDVDADASPDDVLLQAREFRCALGYEVRSVTGTLDDGSVGGEQADARAKPKSGEEEQPPAKRRRSPTGDRRYMNELTPSAELAAIVGSEPQVRTELTAKIWEYIKTNRLEDRKNRKLIHCDEKLRAVTGRDAVTMFELTKYISEHLS